MEEGGEHVLTCNHRDELREDVCKRHHQITYCYVLDDYDDNFMKFEGPVLYGCYENGCVSY